MCDLLCQDEFFGVVLDVVWIVEEVSDCVGAFDGVYCVEFFGLAGVEDFVDVSDGGLGEEV